MNAQELMNKIEWEGGVYEAIIGYGLKESSLTVATPKQKRAWAKAVKDARQLDVSVEKMYSVFPQSEDE